jgi:HAD superfamily hydrolase (TIGR01509 family)
LFDLDGVLIDACNWHRIAFTEAVESFTQWTLSEAKHDKDYNGLPTKVKLAMLVERGIVRKEDVEGISKLKQEKTMKLIEKNAVEDPKKIEMIHWLQNEGISMACVTNSVRASTMDMLERIGLRKYMEAIITNEDIKVGKPSPEGYLLAMDKLGADPNRTVIVEDSEKGLMAAYASEARHVIKVANAKSVNKKLLKDLIE